MFIEIGGAKALGKKIVPILFHVEPNEVPAPISQLLARNINDVESYYAELTSAKTTLSRGKNRPKRKVRTAASGGLASLGTSRKEVDGFKLGDKIRIAQVEHLTADDKETPPKWTSVMDKYSGASATITFIRSGVNVKLSVDDGDFWWATRWLTKEG